MTYIDYRQKTIFSYTQIGIPYFQPLHVVIKSMSSKVRESDYATYLLCSLERLFNFFEPQFPHL